MQHDAHVTFFNCCCSETQRRKTQRKRNAMQLFNLWRLFCPEMQSCMERNCLCAVIPIIFFCDRNGRRRDTERYTGIHWDTRVSQCIPVYPLTRICIPVYPGVSPCVSLDLLTTKFFIFGKREALSYRRMMFSSLDVTVQDWLCSFWNEKSVFRFHRTTGGRISNGFQHSRVQTNAPDRSCANRLQQCLAASVVVPRR